MNRTEVSTSNVGHRTFNDEVRKRRPTNRDVLAVQGLELVCPTDFRTVVPWGRLRLIWVVDKCSRLVARDEARCRADCTSLAIAREQAHRFRGCS